LLLERGVDMNWLQDQLGHASIQMTVDEYGRWAKARKGLASLLDATSSPTGVANAGGGRAGSEVGAPRKIRTPTYRFSAC